MEDDSFDRETCPICQIKKAHHPLLVGVTLAVTHCTSCGIPHFMNPGTIPATVECPICYNRWVPESGGGPDLHYNLGSMRSVTIPTPRGVRFFTLQEEVQ